MKNKSQRLTMNKGKVSGNQINIYPFQSDSSNKNVKRGIPLLRNNDHQTTPTVISKMNFQDLTFQPANQVMQANTQEMLSQKREMNDYNNGSSNKTNNMTAVISDESKNDYGLEDDSEERSSKLHNIWARFESGQIEKVEIKKKQSAEIKELKADIRKLKILHDDSSVDSASQTKLEQIENEKLLELELIKRNRQEELSNLRQKFINLDNVEDRAMTPKTIDFDFEVEKTGNSDLNRKDFIESFKKRLECGANIQNDDNKNELINNEFSQFKTNTNLIKERILNAARENLEYKSKYPIFIGENQDDKVEFVSEPRIDIRPDLVRHTDEMSQLDSEMSKLRQDTAGATTLFKERFENYVKNENTPTRDKKEGVFNEILELRTKNLNNLMPDIVQGTACSNNQHPIKEEIPFCVNTKDKIAKFKALEMGINEQDNSSERAIREITPPRDSEKVVYENEPHIIKDPNYVKSSTTNDESVSFQIKDNARNLASYFEAIPQEPLMLIKENPCIKRFTDPKINITSDIKSEICYLCSRKLYTMEKMDFNKGSIHKNCFKCKLCNTPLRLESYATHDDDVYCLPHFKKLFANEPGLTQANITPIKK
ncbi:LIM domain and actin-binding protein 1-like isoform X2 [Gordionus sp. m RMFG-2023]|uniref:LIM domain and actin-binding protein 1-like isoform X2 n=1 Tax=Gordionus sp. m RMFG-2023 TaxID=3053472 RepID=UPI0031FCFC3A